MNNHAIAIKAIESAIRTMLLPGQGDIAEAKAETMIVSYFSVHAIDSDEFKHYCERVRRIAVRNREGNRHEQHDSCFHA